MNLVHLHVQSGYSFLQSALTPKKILRHALENNDPYLCLCDASCLTGLPQIDQWARAYGKKAIFGADFEIDRYLWSVFVQSEQGYRNLLSLTYRSSRGPLKLDDLTALQEGLTLVLDASSPSLWEKGTLALDIEAQLRALNRALPSFSIGLPYLPKDPSFLQKWRDFLSTHPYPRLAFPRVCYLGEKDAIATEILSAIAKGSTLEEKTKNGGEHFLSQAEVSSYYTNEECQEAENVAVSCSSFVFPLPRASFPHFPLEEGETAPEYLRKRCEEGLAKKRPNAEKKYHERLDYELSVIEKMGYCDYFLIVADYVNFARKTGIPVGPGRGSAAGSLVSYCLDIVRADPLEYGLYFERFLNPERKSMPDIDVDFSDVGRERIVTYLQQKYGHERVSRIMTTQTIGAKQALVDIGRVYGYKEGEVRLLSSSCDPDSSHSLGWNYRYNASFRSLVDSDDYYKTMVSLASSIEGLPRQSGLHAAGIVLNQEPLQTALPIVDDPEQGFIEQYDKEDLQAQGFLKMDLLGLRNLTILESALQNVKQSSGIALSMEDLPYSEPEPLSLVREGKTIGIFQLETPGMTRAGKMVGPTHFEDISALLALYRPGPMQNMAHFAARKQEKEKITYLTPELEPILSPTYGIILYQEQIMQIARKLAGFSFSEADTFRRAISHKDAKELLSLKKHFVEGCLQKGLRLDCAERLFALIDRFADYGFNKSHSVCYAILACQMAWVKFHYPLPFYCAILDDGTLTKEKEVRLFHELKQSGIPLLPPSLNESTLRHIPKGKGILFPFRSISGISSGLANGILDERNQNGAFTDFFSACLRLKKYGLDTASLVSLIDAGCFDDLHSNRESLRLTAPAAIRYCELLVGKEGNETLLDFPLPPPQWVDVPPNRVSDLEGEMRVLGRMVSGSPLEAKKEEIQALGAQSLADLEESKGELTVACILSSCKTILTKKGTKMAFLSVYDEGDALEIVLFDEIYSSASAFLQKGAMLAITARKDSRKEGSYIASSLRPL